MNEIKNLNNALQSLLSGKKTYIVAIAIAGLGVLQGLDIFTMPTEGWAVLSALGLTTLRSGVEKVAKTIK